MRQEQGDGDAWAYVDRRDQLSGRGIDVSRAPGVVTGGCGEGGSVVVPTI